MATISKIKIPNDSTQYDLYDANAVHGIKTVNSQSLRGSTDIHIPDDQMIWFGTCSTSASTATKTIVLADSTDTFNLVWGHILRVLFTYGNTTSSQVKFTCTGAFSNINAYSRDNTGTLVNLYYKWQAGEVIDFMYDGTQFVMMDSGLASTDSFGLVKLSSSTSSTSTVLGASISAFDSLVTSTNNKEDKGTPVDYSSNSSYFYLYDDDILIHLNVYGHLACITGQCRVKTKITGSITQYDLIASSSIPIQYAPNHDVNVLMSGSTYNFWLLNVDTEGHVYFSRYRNTSSYQDAAAGQWVPFHAAWIWE